MVASLFDTRLKSPASNNLLAISQSPRKEPFVFYGKIVEHLFSNEMGEGSNNPQVLNRRNEVFAFQRVNRNDSLKRSSLKVYRNLGDASAGVDSIGHVDDISIDENEIGVTVSGRYSITGLLPACYKELKSYIVRLNGLPHSVILTK